MPEKLTILHCFRAPVGGLFRHVRDLARAQTLAGHDVGIICDSTATDGLSGDRLSELARHCTLGIRRTAMSRLIAPNDVTAARHTLEFVRETGAHVVHGHGAKGGAYARLTRLGWLAAPKGRDRRPVTFYTPHGGSLHYRPGTPKGALFLGLERSLLRLTDGIIFESAYARDRFVERVSKPRCAVRVIHNGLLDEEFSSPCLRDDAAEFVYVGELRDLKGVDILIDALALMRTDPPARCVIVGDGPDAASLRARAHDRGLDTRVTFTGAMPAQEAFTRGRILVVPSRAESFPYIVLEAAAARLPMIVTNVGGIPEIIGDVGTPMLQPDNVAALQQAMEGAIARPGQMQANAAAMQERARAEFRVAHMADQIEGFYREARAVQRTGATGAAPLLEPAE